MSRDQSATAKARYALYFSPADNTELAEFGRRVLCADGLDDDHSQRLSVIQKAAYYGFHATLKAPMELAKGVNESALIDAVAQYVQTQQATDLTGLAPRVLDGFHALTLPAGATEINAFAANVLQVFEPFRAALGKDDRDRREPEKLSPRQREYLDAYGYPYVLDDFRFHMTLSNRMSDKSASDSYHDWLVQLYSNTVTELPRLDRIAVFWQPDRSTAFTRLAEFPVN